MSLSLKDVKAQENNSGFTLIEVLIVISLMSLVYSMVLPRFATDASQAFDSLTRLSNDVRSAFDSAVLSGKNHRLVFNMKSGEYWLEVTEAEEVYLKPKDVDGPDISKSLEEEKKEEFEKRFERYKDLVGTEVTDTDGETKIAPPSPLMKAKKILEGPRWEKVESLEWNVRKISDSILIQDIKTEHHEAAVVIDNLNEEDDALITVQILPSGYIEQTIMHIYFKNAEGKANFESEPFTILIHPTLGMATYVQGLKELDSEGELKESEFL